MSSSCPSTYETTLISSMNKLSVAALPSDDIRHSPLAIFKHGERKVKDYRHLQPELVPEVREILINRLMTFHYYADLTTETLYLAISIFDRFLEAETETNPKYKLEYLVLAALSMATKYAQVREFEDPTTESLVLLANYLYPDDNYENEEVLAMEKQILTRLECKIHFPTPYSFLPCYINATKYSTESIMGNLVYFYAELGMLKYEIINFYPSMVAAAAVYAARATLNKRDVWPKTLEKQAGYKEMEVMDCAKMLVRFHLLAKTETRLVYRKYSHEIRDAVALYSPAKSLLAVASTVSSEFGDLVQQK